MEWAKSRQGVFFSSHFFLVSFFPLLSISRGAAHTLASPLSNKKMAHPGADYDPYDGIVSNPNKKKNPLVLVGAFE